MRLLGDVQARSGAQGCRIVAVSDIYGPHKERARASSGADLHHDWKALVARDDIDAVIIATPDHWHAPMSIAAINAGKDVYCETPMTRTVEEAKAFRDTALATGRIVQIGAQHVSESQWYVARDLIASGALGELRWCQSSYSPSAGMSGPDRRARGSATPEQLDWDAFVGEAPGRPFDRDRFFHWCNYWDYSGGVAAGLLYDRLASLLVAIGPGVPERVSAAGGIYVQDGREVPDSFIMTCEYRQGPTVVLASSMANTGGLPAVIRGREATLYLDGHTLVVEAEREFGKKFQWRFGAETRAELTSPSRQDHMDNWLACLRTREKCACNEDIAYQTMVAVGTSVEAYRRGETLTFDRTTGQLKPGPARDAGRTERRWT